MKKNKKKTNQKKKAIAIALSSALVVAPATEALAIVSSDPSVISSENQSNDNLDQMIDKYIDQNIYKDSTESSNPSTQNPLQNNEITPYTTSPESKIAGEVTIPDANLKAALNAELNKRFGTTKAPTDPITEAEMLKFTGTLDLRSKNITDVTGISAAKNVTILDLRYNNFSTLPNGAFKDLPNLERLILIQCNLTEINPNAFLNIPKLNSLDLGNNKISKLIANQFATIPSLTIIFLPDNPISHIDLAAFNGIPNIYTLVLSRIGLTELKPEYFANLPRFAAVFLTGNKLTHIPDNIFSNHKNLFKIYLDSNQITSIEPNAFAGSTNLEELQLGSNQITNISPNALSASTKLKILNLSNNKLSTLSPSVFAPTAALTDLNLSSNSLSDLTTIPNISSKINATNQKITLKETTLDNKYNKFSITPNTLSSIPGLFGSVQSLNSNMFQGSGASNLSIKPDGSSASFNILFPEGQNSSKVSLSYSLPSPSNKPDHTYSATVEVPVSRDLSLVNYINSTLAKSIDEITLAEGNKLVLIDNDFKGVNAESQKYITDSCPSYKTKMPEYLSRVNDMKNVENYATIVIPNDRNSINSMINVIKSLGASQCLELKSPINSVFTLYLNLIKSDLDKYTLDNLAIKDKLPIKALHDELIKLTSTLNDIGSKDPSIISADVLATLDSHKTKLKPLYEKILELEAAETIENLSTSIEKVINTSVDNLTVDNAKLTNDIYTSLYSQEQAVQDKVIALFPDFNTKMPPLFERAKLISEIQNYSSVNQNSYEDLSKLVDKCFILSQSQTLQLGGQINSIFNIYVNLFAVDINKFTLDTLTINDKDKITQLNKDLTILNEKINQMNSKAGSNIVTSSTQSKVVSNLGKLQSYLNKIALLDKDAASVTEVLDKVNSFISKVPSEITLKDAMNIINANKEFNALSEDLQKEFLSNIDGYTDKMPSFLAKAEKLMSIKNYSYVDEKDRVKLKALIKSSEEISFSQRLELKGEIDSIFNLVSNILKNDLSAYSTSTVKLSDKEKLLLIKDEIAALSTSLKTVNSPTANGYSNLLANSSILLSDASSRNQTRIVSIETENRINSLSKSIDTLLGKIASLESPNPNNTNKPSTGSGSSSSNQNTSTNTYNPSGSSSGSLAQTGVPLAGLILTLGSASLLGGGYALFRRRK